MDETIYTVYSVDPMSHIHLLDELVRKTDAKVIASSDTGLYNDETMPSITYSSKLSYKEFNDVLAQSGVNDYNLCIEEDWFC